MKLQLFFCLAVVVFTGCTIVKEQGAENRMFRDSPLKTLYQKRD